MEPLILFTHIEKTAGTSFVDTLIAPNFPPDRVVKCAGIRSYRAALKQNPALITGHTPYGLHLLTHRKVTYITFLRDPIERMVSHYYFVRESVFNRYEHPLYRFANSVDIAGFARDRRFHNRQTRFIAGLAAHKFYDRIPSAAFERLVLAQAKRNLERRYACFGLQERFDDSVTLFRRTFGWDAVEQVERQKKTRGRPLLQDLDAATLQTLREANALDIALYAFAQKRFDEVLFAQRDSDELLNVG